MSQQNNPVAYTLVIDKEARKHLQLMMNCTKQFLEEHEEILRDMPRSELISLADFVGDISNKSHETFGCNDPECSWKPENEGNKPVSQGEI